MFPGLKKLIEIYPLFCTFLDWLCNFLTTSILFSLPCLYFLVKEVKWRIILHYFFCRISATSPDVRSFLTAPVPLLKSDSCIKTAFEPLGGRDIPNPHFPGLAWELRCRMHVDGGWEASSMSESLRVFAVLSCSQDSLPDWDQRIPALAAAAGDGCGDSSRALSHKWAPSVECMKKEGVGTAIPQLHSFAWN